MRSDERKVRIKYFEFGLQTLRQKRVKFQLNKL